MAKILYIKDPSTSNKPLVLMQDDDIIYVEFPSQRIDRVGYSQIKKLSTMLEAKDIESGKCIMNGKRHLFISMRGDKFLQEMPEAFMRYALSQWITAKAA